MTETPKSATYLLAKARDILLFDGGWPDEFRYDDLAALMAGGYRESDSSAWELAILEAMETRKLAYRTPENGLPVCWPSTIMRPVDRMKWNFPYDLFIDRNQFAAWLHRIGEEPSELVRAWLGDTWQERTTETIEKRTRRALIDECCPYWETIERDIQDAGSNGLSAAARLKNQSQGWDKNRALAWAKEKGKLKSEPEKVKPATWLDPLYRR